jgi:hypothetical protein
MVGYSDQHAGSSTSGTQSWRRMVTCANDHFLLVHGLQGAYKSFANLAIR